MMNSSPQHNPTDDATRDVELAFMEAYARGERLDAWLARYPQHARNLIDLAMALDADAALPAPAPEDLARAQRTLQTALEEVAGVPASSPVLGLVARARARGLRVPQLAAMIGIGSDVVVKLDRGYVAAQSIPARLLRRIAEALETTSEVIAGALPRTPATAGAMYFAEKAPAEAAQETFAEALARSEEMSDEDRAVWYAVLKDEGLME